jgi:hypothetical protein
MIDGRVIGHDQEALDWSLDLHIRNASVHVNILLAKRSIAIAENEKGYVRVEA